MAKKLNKNKSIGRIIGPVEGAPGAVYSQDGFYFDIHGVVCGERPKPVQKTAVSKAKETEARDETLARATAILGDLGSPTVDVQADARKENAAVAQAETHADNV